MRVFITTVFVVFITLVLVTGSSSGMAEGKKAHGKQTLCPVLDNPIDRSVYTDYKGKRIYFCCPACKDDFRKNPEKFMKKMRDQGVEPEAVPGK